jgi:hypothetical protein
MDHEVRRTARGGGGGGSGSDSGGRVVGETRGA